MFLMDASSPIGSGTKCHLFLLNQLPSEVVTIYDHVPTGSTTVASVRQSGIHTDLPCSRHGKCLVLWRPSKFIFCLGLCFSPSCLSSVYLGKLGISCFGKTGKVVRIYLPIEN